MVYTSEHLPTSVLEMLVHVDAGDIEGEFTKIHVEIPDHLIDRFTADQLPSDWDINPSPASSRAFGDAWLASKSNLGLCLPSAVVPEYLNILINPLHPGISELKEIERGIHIFDRRLIKTVEAPPVKSKTSKRSTRGHKST